MKRRKLLSALLLLTSLTLPLAACSSANFSASADSNGAQTIPGGAVSGVEAPALDYDGVTEESVSISGGGSYYENTKIILTADLSLQATDFDSAVAALDALVTAQGGYYESAEYTYGGYYSGGNRWGYFTIRVPKEHFDAFLNAVGDVAHLVRSSRGTQDVGEAYYDAQLHLSTLQTKHERLLALLEQAELMEDIIALESALSDVEYQIQQYSSTLTRYDGLIDFATIQLNLQEVVRVSETTTEADPLSVRMGAAFTRGWHSFCDGMADFAVWLAYNFIGVLIFLVVVVVVVLLLIRWRRGRQQASCSAQFPEEPKDKS